MDSNLSLHFRGSGNEGEGRTFVEKGNPVVREYCWWSHEMYSRCKVGALAYVSHWFFLSFHGERRVFCFPDLSVCLLLFFSVALFEYVWRAVSIRMLYRHVYRDDIAHSQITIRNETWGNKCTYLSFGCRQRPLVCSATTRKTTTLWRVVVTFGFWN